jgi:hypothetical protein
LTFNAKDDALREPRPGLSAAIAIAYIILQLLCPESHKAASSFAAGLLLMALEKRSCVR